MQISHANMILETECHWSLYYSLQNFEVEAGVFGIEGSTSTTPIDRTLSVVINLFPIMESWPRIKSGSLYRLEKSY